MITLAYFWPLDLLGRLHPLLVHFPIGLLMGALLMECWSRLRQVDANYSGIVHLGAAAGVFSAIAGLVLRVLGDYEGELVDQHQLVGYLTAGLARITSFLYWHRHRISGYLPFVGLIVTCLSLSLAGHLGASITQAKIT